MNIEFLYSVFYCNLICLPIWFIIRYLVLKKTKNNITGINIKYEVLVFLFIAYIISVVAVTLIPLSFSTGNNKGYINFTPVVSQINIISIAWHNHTDISFLYENYYGNILMFTPFGFFIPILIPSKYSFFVVFLIALAASSFIEIGQWIERYWHSYRIVDIDDVILNTIGACVGFAFYKLFRYICNIKIFYSYL